MAPKIPTVNCGEWRAHAAHGPWYHWEYGDVTCPGRAFDHPPDAGSKVPGLVAIEEVR